MIVFATAGKPESYGKRTYPHELPAYLEGFGLNGFEVQCGKGVNISSVARDKFPVIAKKHGLNLSIHAPYYISLSSAEEEKRIKSVEYIMETARAAKQIRAERIVVHSGSCAKMKRSEALALALETLKKARTEMDSAGLNNIIICPETMGKINQLGDLDEVLELCSFDNRMLPCIDFGHLNARSLGGLKSRADYAAVFDAIENKLGAKRLHNLHIHFSKIEYTDGGEKKHLTFADTEYGPDYEPFIDEIIARNMQPFIVCESDGTQAEDCSEMAAYYSKTYLK